MENRINLVELLKDCPKGMELDCTMFGNVYFDGIVNNELLPIRCFIKHPDGGYHFFEFTKHGCWLDIPSAKCIIFPKGKTTWEGFVPPCKFNDGDERVRKAILTGLIDCRDAPDLGWSNFGGIEIDDCIAWIEKQGEQKSNPCEKCDHVMLNCQNVPCIKTFDKGKSALEAIREEKVDNANKIEPKFKIEKDKWYVCIRDLDDNYGGAKAFCKGSIYYSTKDETLIPENSNIPSEIKYCVNHYFRPWTIEDAKDGDVLANKNGAIFINAGSSGGGTLDCYCYLSVQNEFCIEEHKTGSWLYKDDIKPATKEQCNLLFQRMKEAGYLWDAEKKDFEKLPKFKVGDRVTNGKISITIGYLTDNEYYDEIGRNISNILSIKNQDNWKLVHSKFDITTLIPFESKVLVRGCNSQEWVGEIFTRYNNKVFDNCNFVTLGGICWKQCIPYNDETKHLLGNTSDCDEYYKTWE